MYGVDKTSTHLVGAIECLRALRQYMSLSIYAPITMSVRTCLGRTRRVTLQYIKKPYLTLPLLLRWLSTL